MIIVEAEPARNLLTVTYCGHVTAEEFGPAIGKIEKGLGILKEGLRRQQESGASRPTRFRLLTDLSGLESMDVACAPLIDEAMDLINAAGVAVVVRIVPDPRKDIGFMVMSMFHYRPDVGIVTVETVEEAQRALGD